MTRRDLRRWALIAGWVLLIAVLVGASLEVVTKPVTAQPAEEPTNGCGAAVTASASPDTVRICDPSDIEVAAAPSCPACPGGVHVVFVQREQATDGRWQGQASMGALDKLEEMFPDQRLKAAVVQYGPGKVRTAVRITDNLSQVRGALNRARTVDNPPDHNSVGNAASREALRALQSAREDTAPLPPCELVIFFAQDSPCPT